MKRNLPSIIFIITIFFTVGYLYIENSENDEEVKAREYKLLTKKARTDYFFNILRDPKTNSIPKNIRSKELEFATKLSENVDMLHKSASTTFTWKEAGPNDVGGRTRALAVDRTNSNVILAGGASGGVWKSTDNGETWKLTTSGYQLSVTYITQDYNTPTTWYYTSGEYNGTAGDNMNRVAPFYGSGFYRSTDNGETWTQIQTAGSDNSYDSPFDYVSKVLVSPVTGSLFIASHNFGILKSTDNGDNFSRVLGNNNDHSYVEFDINTTGHILATLSTGYNFSPEKNPGVYLSGDDGESWSVVLDNTYDSNYESPSRAVIKFAPSNLNVAYLWADFGDNTRFYKLDFTQGMYFDRTNNLPDFGGDAGELNTQGSYNMILDVKPDDENFVLLGATNLFRSFDGFATPADDEFTNWIGGYDVTNDISSYPNHHPDNHSLFFDPNNPNKLWSGHDGGLSYTEDITNSSSRINWQSKNNSYNVTQFYHLSIASASGDTRIIGGTQDNGSPYFTFDGEITSNSIDASTGDGSFSYISENHLYSSSQNGSVVKLNLLSDGTPDENSWSIVPPLEAENKRFIHPFAIDPSNENVMYYPDGNILWRNSSITTIENQENYDGTTEGWDNIGAVDGLEEATHSITAISVSNSNPSNVLYLGLTSGSEIPKIFKLTNSTTNTSFTDISIPEAEAGTFVYNIAVNPTNGNEIIVSLSNYNITSLYRSTDGGNSYQAISGNLDGEDGPSVRSVSILPINDETYYFTATSAGLFSTTTLNGNETVWILEAGDVIGNVVVSNITSRTSDGKVAIATHGRGIFVASPDGSVDVNEDDQIISDYKLEQNYPNPFNPTTKINYSIPESGFVTLKIFDVLGKEVSTLVNADKSAGNYEINFDASNLSTGIYIYTMQINNFVTSKKMILLK